MWFHHQDVELRKKEEQQKAKQLDKREQERRAAKKARDEEVMTVDVNSYCCPAAPKSWASNKEERRRIQEAEGGTWTSAAVRETTTFGWSSTASEIAQRERLIEEVSASQKNRWSSCFVLLCKHLSFYCKLMNLKLFWTLRDFSVTTFLNKRFSLLNAELSFRYSNLLIGARATSDLALDKHSTIL